MRKLTRTLDPPAVQVMVLFGSDTNLVTRTGSPVSAATFMAGVDASVLEVRRFYWDQCSKYTFTAVPSVLYRSPLTGAQISAETNSALTTLQNEAIKAWQAGLLGLSSPWRYCLFTTPLELPSPPGSFVGEHGSGNFDSPKINKPYDQPGLAMISYGKLGRLMGGILAPVGDPAGVGQPRGVMAHEMGHGFGYELPDGYAHVPGNNHPPPVSFGLSHPPNPPTDAPTDPFARVMLYGYVSFPNAGFSAEETRLLLTTQFLTYHATRP